MSHQLILLLSAFVWISDAQGTAKFEDKSLTVKTGGATILPCKLTQTLQKDQTVEQISWERTTKGKPQTDSFLIITAEGDRFVNGKDYRFKYVGTFADHNGTLQLSNVNLNDEGSYKCIFSIFGLRYPSISMALTVLVPPQTSIEDAQPILGNQEVTLATCIAAGAKPPAEVVWKTSAVKDKVRVTNNSTLHANGTMTTVSILLGIPTKEIHQSLVHCAISFQEMNQTLPFELQIYYPPQEVSIKHGLKDQTVSCESDANPNATFTWSRSGQTLPPSVIAQGAFLTFEKRSTDVDGSYICEAKNKHGSNKATLYLYASVPDCTVCWTLFGLLFVAVAVAVVVGFPYKRGVLTTLSCLREREAVPTRDGSPDVPMS